LKSAKFPLIKNIDTLCNNSLEIMQLLYLTNFRTTYILQVFLSVQVPRPVYQYIL